MHRRQVSCIEVSSPLSTARLRVWPRQARTLTWSITLPSLDVWILQTTLDAPFRCHRVIYEFQTPLGYTNASSPLVTDAGDHVRPCAFGPPNCLHGRSRIIDSPHRSHRTSTPKQPFWPQWERVCASGRSRHIPPAAAPHPGQLRSPLPIDPRQDSDSFIPR